MTRIEMRYLADRCIITPDGAGPAIRKMIDRLSRNEVVSITALASGRKTIQRSFMDRTITLATGAPNIADTAGACLLPVFVLPNPSGFCIRIGQELSRENEGACVDQYLMLLEEVVRENPYLWSDLFEPVA
jgi:lauroyl/myristoyl acyltransferase